MPHLFAPRALEPHNGQGIPRPAIPPASRLELCSSFSLLPPQTASPYQPVPRSLPSQLAKGNLLVGTAHSGECPLLREEHEEIRLTTNGYVDGVLPPLRRYSTPRPVAARCADGPVRSETHAAAAAAPRPVEVGRKQAGRQAMGRRVEHRHLICHHANLTRAAARVKPLAAVPPTKRPIVFAQVEGFNREHPGLLFGVIVDVA
mmetsp:Transcript_24462/g.78956  ORF Transcript_24462/g.78956 Transcript_24462/m.78956 type:complete len:203 (-) Transcript_24462:393-1001(-)